MDTLSPHEQRLHRTLLRELTKDELGNKVRHAHTSVRIGQTAAAGRSHSPVLQVKLGARAPAKLRHLALDTHDSMPAYGVSKARTAPREHRPVNFRQVWHISSTIHTMQASQPAAFALLQTQDTSNSHHCDPAAVQKANHCDARPFWS